MTVYEKFEKDCAAIREQNKVLIQEFEAWLTRQGLAKSTVNNHCTNVDFYINDYLLYDDAVPAKDGSCMINMFLGYWFIKKAMWASAASIKQNAASLKKFYRFMLEKNEITIVDFHELTATIKEGMSEWQATMGRYDDPEIVDMEDVWGF
jgi:site-specific recombinase XerD